jgi:hypothetical protein
VKQYQQVKTVQQAEKPADEIEKAQEIKSKG